MRPRRAPRRPTARRSAASATRKRCRRRSSHPHYKMPLGPNQGRGVASGFWFNAGGESSAQVNINEDGTVVVVTGHPDIGGSRASMVNIAAELLGIDYRQVQALIGDTSSMRFSRAHRRQPRHVRRRHGGDEGDRAGDPDPARAGGQDLEDRCRGRRLGERRGPSRRLQRRRFPAADAGADRRQGERHRRPDQRALVAQHRRRAGRVRQRKSAMSRSIRRRARSRSSATRRSRTSAGRSIRATWRGRSRAASCRASAGR